MSALRTRGLAVVDLPPPFRFGTQDLPRLTRTFEPFIVMLLPDEEAWDALFDDAFRLEVFKTWHGNKPWLKKREAW